MDYLLHLLDPSGFVPRAVCGRWTRWEVLLNNVSDFLIALAYVLIPVILVYFTRRRRDLPFSWVFLVFGAFIITCGSTHVLEIVLFYHPIYHLAGWLKLLTALASWAAVAALIHIAPSALALRSPAELEALNRELAQEVEHRRQAEQELALKNQRLEESERLKDEFLANVSHELRTPLTLILSPVESLLANSEAPLNPGQRATLELVQANSVRLLQQVNDLLDFSRFQAGRLEIHREPTPLAGFTGNLVSAFTKAFQAKGVELVYQGPAEQGRLLDRYLYERILFNLLSNALKHTPAGGRVEVRLSSRDEAVDLWVSDNGPGIAEPDQPFLFERFRQGRGDSRRSGTGLGLALVREFSSVLGGGVSLVSQPGQGASFRVALLAPICELPGEVAEIRPAQPAELPRILPAAASTDANLPRLLIAEDNPELASYMAVVLRGVAEIKTVRDGQQALAEMERWRPQLVLSDVMMPGLTGFGLCRAIKGRAEWGNIPVILITALTHREALLEGWESGADEFLFKPFHPTELVTRVRSLLANAGLREELQHELRRMTEELEERVRERSQELEEARARAEAANRAKSMFLGNLSHELRTPLAGVLGMAELALGDEPKPEVREKLQAIRQAAGGLDGLLEDLLEFSRLESGRLTLRPAPFELGSLVEQVHSSLAHQAGARGLQWKLERSDPLPSVVGDEARLRHVLLNLLVNALKFTERGQVVLRVQALHPAGRIHFAVEDTGIGIAPADQERIFQPFTQVDDSLARVQQGAGLGLAISQELVDLMGGKLRLHSQSGQGSTFEFELNLPVCETIQTAAPPAASSRPRRLLLVEDNPLNRTVVRLMLERAGHSVVTSETAGQGLAAYRAEKFDLVLLDLQLPDMDGLEAARLMHDHDGSIPLVALTAHAGDHYRQLCEEHGFRAFLTKPIESPELFAALEPIW